MRCDTLQRSDGIAPCARDAMGDAMPEHSAFLALDIAFARASNAVSGDDFGVWGSLAFVVIFTVAM